MARPKKAAEPPTDFGMAVLHNQLARCNTDLGVTSMRLIMLMADQVRQDAELTPMRLRVQDYQKKLHLSGKSNSTYDHLDQVVDKLMKTVIRTPRPVGGQHRFQVLAPTDDDGAGEFTLRFNEGMKPLLLSLKELFCKIPLEIFFRIQGAYAVRFYLFCKSWDPAKHETPHWRMTVQELRQWLDFKPGEYEKSFHIRAAVIERAKKELDRIADVSFEYDSLTEGGRTVGWSFTPVVNRPKGGKIDRRRKAQLNLPLDSADEPPPPIPNYTEETRLWKEATELQRSAWLAQSETLAFYAPRDNEKPRPAFLVELRKLTQTAEAVA